MQRLRVSLTEERSFSAVCWHSNRYFCIAWHTAAGYTGCRWGGSCLFLLSGLCAGTSPVDEYQWCLCGFNHRLQSPPVLEHAGTMACCEVSNQDAVKCSVKFGENLHKNFVFLSCLKIYSYSLCFLYQGVDV